MTATMEELGKTCDAIQRHAEAGEDIGNLGFELIQTARALRDNGEKAMDTHTCTHEKPLVTIKRCLDCGSEWRVTENNVVPVLAPCPMCHGMAHACVSDKRGIFWQCNDCQNSFDDINGAPDSLN